MQMAMAGLLVFDARGGIDLAGIVSPFFFNRDIKPFFYFYPKKLFCLNIIMYFRKDLHFKIPGSY